MVINHTNNEVENIYTLRQLQISSDVMYNWGYGNWDGTESMNDSTFFFYIHTGIFIGLVMFNLLIAIISGTYDEFAENKDMTDLNEILAMLSEMASFVRFCRLVKEFLIGATKDKEVYYHFLIPDELDDDIKIVKNRVAQLEEKTKSNHLSVEKKIKETKEELKKRLEEVKKNQEDIKKKVVELINLQKPK